MRDSRQPVTTGTEDIFGILYQATTKEDRLRIISVCCTEMCVDPRQSYNYL
jgi:hypothetical protein